MENNKSDSTTNHVRGCYELAILKEKSSLNQSTPLAKFHTVSLKEEGGSILIFTKCLGFSRYYAADIFLGERHPRTSTRRD